MNRNHVTMDAEVIIVGGGPVGLLLANLLGRAGRSVLLLEADAITPERSMAIGITPPSLDILKTIGLDASFVRAGIKIEQAVVHENGDVVSNLPLNEWPDAYRFILSLPQVCTIRLLRDNLASMPRVNVMTGWRVTGIVQDKESISVTAHDSVNDVTRTFHARLAAGCDGARSEMAAHLGLRHTSKTYRPSFVMGDFIDRSGLGSTAHLFFGAERPVESFPLPDERRRWIVRCGWNGRDDLSESLAASVSRLTGIALDPRDQKDESWFQPRRKLCRSFYRGRVALCGDAAHVMSPIGGQGMNTGFGDAMALARAFQAILDGEGPVDQWMRRYNRHRRLVFRRAAARAAIGMSLGVARGRVGSRMRRHVVRFLLGHANTRHFLARWFTMRSLPHPMEMAG